MRWGLQFPHGPMCAPSTWVRAMGLNIIAHPQHSWSALVCMGTSLPPWPHVRPKHIGERHGGACVRTQYESNRKQRERERERETYVTLRYILRHKRIYIYVYIYIYIYIHTGLIANIDIVCFLDNATLNCSKGQKHKQA